MRAVTRLVLLELLILIVPAITYAQASTTGVVRDSSAALNATPSSAVDVARGKQLYQACAACHSILGDGIGPDLQGIFGQKAGSKPDFTRYSPAMKASGIVWNEETLRRFLTAPQAEIKGNLMFYPGLKKPADLDDVIAYLETYK